MCRQADTHTTRNNERTDSDSDKTHLFSDVLEGHLCRAAPGPEQYVAGEPGCWWIQPVNLFIANKQQVTRLDTDKILQVPYISMAFSP
jgi:hypothetical protein